MLNNPEKADGEAYAAKSREIQRPLEENSKKIFNTIDTLELQIVKDRNNAVASLSFQNAANAVMEAGSSISSDVKELNAGVRQMMLSSTDAEVGRLAASPTQTQKRVEGNIAVARKLLLASGQKELARNIALVSGTVQRAGASIRKIEAAKLGVIRSNLAMQKALVSARGISKEQAQRSEEQVKSIGENQQQILTGVRRAVENATLLSFVMIGVSLAVALVSLLISLRIIASITKPLAHAKLVTAEIAAGDLTKRVELGSQDEISDICGSINNIVVHFHEVISRVSHNTAQVASASEEMAATSNEIAVSCTQAAAGSQQANDAAITGAGVVRETVQGMNQIAEKVRETALSIDDLGKKSQQIGAIVGTIDDIADQTNLLALNAAIEAARAGEQGRGFAVVADEVRALAQRTSSATREIAEMIKSVQLQTKGAIVVMESGVARVEQGTVDAAKSGQALEEILRQISAVAVQVNQIASAAEEQTATTGEISHNIQNINAVVQDTAKNAQESAASAQLLPPGRRAADAGGTVQAELTKAGPWRLAPDNSNFEVNHGQDTPREPVDASAHGCGHRLPLGKDQGLRHNPRGRGGPLRRACLRHAPPRHEGPCHRLHHGAGALRLHGRPLGRPLLRLDLPQKRSDEQPPGRRGRRRGLATSRSRPATTWPTRGTPASSPSPP